jgi:hypothetical protein
VSPLPCCFSQLLQNWSKAQSSAAPENASDAFVVEYKFQDGVCLTEEKRAELQEQVQSSINKLRGEGKIAAIDSSLRRNLFFRCVVMERENEIMAFIS